MASVKDLKKRIGTVKNTQQTTRAMKMVSAAKLRRAQDAITSQRPYAKRLVELIRSLLGQVTGPVRHPLVSTSSGVGGLEDHSESSQSESRESGALLVLVTSDRGLCGAFNSNVIKAAQRWTREHSASAPKVMLSFVGRKGYDFYKNKGHRISKNYSEVTGKVTFAKAKKLAEDIIERFKSGEFREVYFIYNEFKNAAAQEVIVEKFLPLEAPQGSQPAAEGSSSSTVPPILKPDPQMLLDQLLAKSFSIQAFRILLESQAGEHGARMSAMENATKNASEMIRKLTLEYNKQRQAGITKELLEIISGSESQKVAS